MYINFEQIMYLLITLRKDFWIMYKEVLTSKEYIVKYSIPALSKMQNRQQNRSSIDSVATHLLRIAYL